jgi:ATP-binding cassette subfamily B protein
VRYLPKLLPYLKPYWLHLLISVVITVLAALVSLGGPWPLQFIIDNVLSSHSLPALLSFLAEPAAKHPVVMLAAATAIGLAITFAAGLLDVLHNYVTTKVQQGLSLDFRSDLFQHAQRLSLTYHDRNPAGGVVYAINYHGGAAASLLMAGLPLAQSVLTLAGMFLITFFMDPLLAMVSLMVVPFLYSSVGYYAMHIQPRIRKAKLLEGESIEIIHEAMGMLRVIVAFGREPHEYRRFREQGQRMVNARVDVTVRQTVFSLVVGTTTAIGTALVVGLGAYHVLEGRLTVGRLLVILAYVAAVYQPLEAISNTLGSLQEYLAGMWVAFHLMDAQPGIIDKPHAIDVGRAEGRVTYDKVRFSYTDRANTLTDISFDAQPGHVIAVVGPTGAGKTTLASLMLRFYEVSEGRILLDGVDIRDLKIKSLRQQISIVLQEPILFRGSVAENIRYGRLDARRAEIVEAAIAANAHKFIMDLPRRYETDTGERGVQLSGGERQRIAIARAFLKDAPILILDEPTSSIDSDTEEPILNALDQLMVGRTTFVIAHRLSTLRRADHIIVLNHGRLVEQGSREELLKRAGLFKHLWDLQLGNGHGPAEAALVPAPRQQPA